MSQYVVLNVSHSACGQCSGAHYQAVNLNVFSVDIDSAVDTLVQSIRHMTGTEDTTERWMGLQETQVDEVHHMMVLCPRIHLVHFHQGRILERMWAETSLHE